MTTLLRFVSLAVVAFAAFGVFFAPGGAQAQQPFTVTVSAAAGSYAVGEDAAFRVRINGATATLPSFSYDVSGGTIEGVLPPTPVATNVAEGTVFVSRATAGTARLTVSFAGQTLGSADVQFVGTGSIQVRATLNAGADAAARTWRYEVVNAAGSVVATMNVSTSGDAPNGTATAASLPYGTYTVRQVLGSDTALSCAGGAFYAVSAPAGASTRVELNASSRTAAFTIVPCPALPGDLQVQIPVDTIAPGGSGGVVGEAEGLVPPGETPFSEVAGARSRGPIPLPPDTGDSALAAEAAGNPFLALAISALALSLTTIGLWSGKVVMERRR